MPLTHFEWIDGVEGYKWFENRQGGFNSYVNTNNNFYGRTGNILDCPSSSIGNTTAVNTPDMNYGYNVTIPNHGYTPGRIDASGRASKLVTFCDSKGYVISIYEAPYTTYFWDYVINPVHNGGANFAFWDGHVEWMQRTSYYNNNLYRLP